MKILIAEDEEDVTLLYKMALEDKGHSVIVAYNGEECLAKYFAPDSNEVEKRTNPFDVVILDYKMPGKNGIQVAQDILSKNPSQRIIFASAFVKETLEESVNQLNSVMEVMQKPFDVDELVNIVENKEIQGGMNTLNEGIEKDSQLSVDKLKTSLDQIRKLMNGKDYDYNMPRLNEAADHNWFSHFGSK